MTIRSEADLQRTAQCLLEQAAALRAIGRRLLEDATADDLVQDTYVAAVEGAAPRGSLAAWLLGIGGRLALMRRRSSVRRLARERKAAREATVPSTDESVAATEAMQRVALAVHELPEAYRTVIVLRYWHDCAPRVIARRLAVPVNTVHSRLQRGLGLLRNRLDERGRGAWAGPLAAFLRAGRIGAVHGSWLGAITMGTKAKVGIVAALGGCGVAIVLALGTSEPALTTTVANDAGLVARAQVDGRDPVARVAAEALACTVVGRCVDATTGAPLAACRVVLLPQTHKAEAAVRPQPHLGVTGSDGCFRFDAVQPAHAHRLMCGAGSFVAMERSLAPLPVGTSDLGDIAMVLGAVVVGTVRNAVGEGVAGVVFELERVGVAAPAASAEAWVPCRVPPMVSRADGVLEQLGGGLAPGAWRLGVRTQEHQLRSAAEFDVAPGQRRVVLDLIVRSLVDQPAIAGVLVDESGLAVDGVELRASDGSFVRCGGDGTFVLHRRSDAEAAVRLVLGAGDGCALVSPDAEYEWGSKDHRVVVRRPAGVWLTVVDAARGDPVDEYGVWLLPLDRDADWPRLLARGHHENGRVQLTKVQPGRYRVVVQPEEAMHLASDPIEVDLAAGAHLRIEVEVARPLAIEVRSADGDPVVGSSVDLFRHEGEGELDVARIGGTALAYQTVVSATAFPVLSSAKTGADGRARLLTPSRGRLGLRVRGTHVPRIVERLLPPDGDTPVVVVVERGATIAGSVSPANLLRELAPSPDEWARGVVGGEFGDPKRPWPTLVLRSKSRPPRLLPARIWLGQPGFPVGDDGMFRIDGVPPGDWQIELVHGVGGVMREHAVGHVAALAAGERREVAIDIRSLQPGELVATVLLDGELLRRAEVHFGDCWLRTDGEGRVAGKVHGSSHLCLAGPDGSLQGGVASDETIAVGPGERVACTIALSRRRLRIRVLHADGTAMVGKTFGVSGPVGGEDVGKTDAQGWLLLDPAPPYEFKIYTRFDDGQAVRVVCWSTPLRMPLDRKYAELEARFDR